MSDAALASEPSTTPRPRRAPSGRLTLKQERFVAAYLKTRNASAAYRLAYDCETAAEATINVEACRLLQHPKIAPRIAQIHERTAEKTNLTIEAIADEIKKVAIDEEPTDHFKWQHKIDGIKRAMKFLGMEKREEPAPTTDIRVSVVLVNAPGVPR